MPSLDFPTGDVPIFGGDLPVVDSSSVLAELPAAIQRPETAPVRDALCAAFAEGFLEYQRRSELAAAQCDPLRAEGDYLADLADERGVVRFQGESEKSLRSRLFLPPSIVTPDAIKDAVDAILAPYTTKTCRVSELELDGWYCSGGTAWDGGFIGVSPRYPDRFYVDDAAENDGFYIEGCEPGGCIPSQGIPRSFHIRFPLFDGDDEFAFCIDAVDEAFWIADGSDTSGAESDGSVTTFVFGDYRTVQEIYDLIVGTVEAIKGHGITWSAVVDTAL